jgi:hypothetical protein
LCEDHVFARADLAVHVPFSQGSYTQYFAKDGRGNEMNSRIAAAAGVLLVMLLGGCSSHPEPIIDMQGVDESALEADWVDCEQYSEEVIIAKGATRGAAGGAVAGAAAGAIGGNVSSGAGYGAIWGATRSSSQGAREKEGVFKRCLRGRGYRVLN